MSPVLVDSNVILDVIGIGSRFRGNSQWTEWSQTTLRRLGDETTLVINALIFAEASVGFDSQEQLEELLPEDEFRREGLPYGAAFLAGKAFAEYRRRGGIRRSPLPDFYIGAHAAVAGFQLLTRDATRYRTYFPSVSLIAPNL